MPNGRRPSNCGLFAPQFPLSSLFSAEVTGPIFAKILHDVDALVALLNHAYTMRYSISFRNARAKSEGGQF